MAQFHEEIQIQAAAAAVYTKFSAISQWHTWYPDVIGASWATGNAWEENAQFTVQVKNFLGMTAKGLSVVRLNSADKMLVWENSMPGLQVVATARFAESVGGCKFSISKSTHGPLSPLMPLLSGRQNKQLRTGMENLKALIEGDLSRK